MVAVERHSSVIIELQTDSATCNYKLSLPSILYLLFREKVLDIPFKMSLIQQL